MKSLTLYIFSFVVFCYFNGFGQLKLSQYSEVSILTIGPGTQLNDAFGHSAIRIKDPMYKLDVVYDYGRYDFAAEGFYLNFAKGQLDYQIGWENYDRFIQYYTNQQRRVEAQYLNLTISEKQQLFSRLQYNILPQNRSYAYDFFYNNCATKIKDDLVNISEKKIDFVSHSIIEPLTFRALIRTKVPENSWGGFGIDLALGAVIDKEASAEEHMFLPSNLKKLLQFATFESTSQQLVAKTEILSEPQKPYPTPFWNSPGVVLSALSVLIIMVTFKNYKSGSRTKIVDIALFAMTSIVGIVILLLWFATNHSATAFNYNLLWAFAINGIWIPFLAKNKVSLRFVGYLKFLILLLSLMLLHWITGVQSFNMATLPLCFALLVRYLYLIYWNNKQLNPRLKTQ